MDMSLSPQSQPQAPQHRHRRCLQHRSRASAEAAQEWAQRAGIVAPKLQIHHFAGLRGMRALEGVAENEVFVSLPKEAALVITPLQKCPFPELCTPKFYTKAPWYVKMALQILYERGQGAGSRVVGYIQGLPQGFNMPLVWSDEQLTRLSYPPLLAEVAKQRESWQRLYESYGESSPQAAVSQEDFYWALQAVRSRAFSGPHAGADWRTRAKLALLLAVLGTAAVNVLHLYIEDVLNGGIAAALFNLLYDTLLPAKWYAMCPVLDYCNHSSTVETSINYEYFAERFEASGSQAYGKGEQVFISYGPQSNDSLLQYYGFVEEKNVHDTYKLLGLRGCLGGASGDSGPAEEDVAVFSRKGPDDATLVLLEKVLGQQGQRQSADTPSKVVYEQAAQLCFGELSRLEPLLAEKASSSQAADEPAVLARQFVREKCGVLRACVAACERAVGHGISRQGEGGRQEQQQESVVPV